jgi:hypothetical protein
LLGQRGSPPEKKNAHQDESLAGILKPNRNFLHPTIKSLPHKRVFVKLCWLVMIHKSIRPQLHCGR